MVTNSDTKLELYPFQSEDVERMKTMPNILLFSDMGTGKTIETIIHINDNKLYPALVICPTTLKLNWWDEIKKWVDEEPFYCETVDELVEGYFYSLEGSIETKEKRPNWYIIHHEALAYTEGDPIREMISKIRWKCVAVDESHRFRNPYTNRTAALMGLNKDGTKYIFITGTPIVNSTFDLFPMLKMVGLADDEDRFIEKYTIGRKTEWGYQIITSRNKEQLLESLAPIYIRRTKAEVLKDLPPKTYQKIKLIMPPDQREVYDHFEEMMVLLLDEGESLTSTNVLSLMTRLRQLSLDPTILGRKTNSSKSRAILELLEQNPQEKWVVASTSKMFVNLMATRIENCITLTGDDKPLDRQGKIHHFQRSFTKKVLLTTMFTGGLGINLQVANNLIVTDPWWNKATMDQQIDRVHRIGQDKPVTIFELINEKSVDGDMLEKVAAKERMANDIVVEQAVIKSIYERRRGHEYVSPKKEPEGVPEL